MHVNELTSQIIAAAIEVHSQLGPGLLESTYEECLCHELSLRGLSFKRQQPVSVVYKGIRLECGYRYDILVEDRVIIEVKSVDALAPVHEAQLLTYLRLGGWQVGLLLNFNVVRMKDGIVRRVLNLKE
ncbi:MAG: GxxExxY protein [Abditibacteriales bacterium]|nr:GxxExxY protein [Abditibacteriales bacterium]MDW8365379.1 GxxExxY protein [Abditibacteriales bacterium]